MDVSLTEPQTAVFSDTTRFRVLVAGRRFGKSFLSAAELLNSAIGINKKTGLPNEKKTVVYIAPTFAMCKQIMWTSLTEFAPPSYIKRRNESELTLEFHNGSKIYLRSADNYDSLRGLSLSFAVLDEVADIHPDAWSLVLRPALSDQVGDVLFIGTPKGYSWFYDLYTKGLGDRPTWNSFHYTTLQGGNVPAEEIEEAKRDMTDRDFKQEYLASFESSSNKVIYNFDRQANVSEIARDLGGELLIGQDFNISAMSAVVGCRSGDTLFIFDEYLLVNSNTRELYDTIVSDYPGREAISFPDPSGRARKTSAIGGETDFTIIRSYGIETVAPKKAPSVADSISNTNILMCNGKNERRILIHPKCQHLIKCLDFFTYKEGTSVPDKEQGYDHMVDALRYLVWSEFKVGNKTKQIKVKGF